MCIFYPFVVYLSGNFPLIFAWFQSTSNSWPVLCYLSLDVSFPKLLWLDRIQRKKIFCARLIFRLSRQKKWNLAVQILLAGLSSSLDGDLIESFCGLARQGKKWVVNLRNGCYMGECFSSNILEFWCALSCIYFFTFCPTLGLPCRYSSNARTVRLNTKNYPYYYFWSYFIGMQLLC